MKSKLEIVPQASSGELQVLNLDQAKKVAASLTSVSEAKRVALALGKDIREVNDFAMVVIEKKRALGQWYASLPSARELGTSSAIAESVNTKTAQNSLSVSRKTLSKYVHIWLCPVEVIRNLRDAANEAGEILRESEIIKAGSMKSQGLTDEEVEEEIEKLNHRAQGTGENEWYTPERYIVAARNVLGGIDLDPASSEIANETVKAARIYTIEDSGLDKQWLGKIWLNPPYSQPEITQFAEKVADEWDKGNIESAIVLTHNYTDTKWFGVLATSCSALCFTVGRIAFESPIGEKASPTQGQTFFYYGTKYHSFVETFGHIGHVFSNAVASPFNSKLLAS